MSQPVERFERIHPTPAYELVAQAIEREIISGRLRTGEPIGTEAELVRQFGVNRSTVREGIRLLEQAGLVHRGASRRRTVCLPHYDQLASRMSRALVLHEVTFRELWEASMVLEVAAVEQAALRATPAVLAELEDNIAKSEAAQNPAAVAELDTEWHALIAKAAQNRVLQLAREPTMLLNVPTTGAILENIAAGVPRLLEAHRAIVEAVRRRDVEAARLWMRRHLNDWRKGFERLGKDLDQPVDNMALHPPAPTPSTR